MQPCPPERHDREEGSIHDREPITPELLRHITEDDLAEFILETGSSISEPVQDLVGGCISGAEQEPRLKVTAISQTQEIMILSLLDHRDVHPAPDLNGWIALQLPQQMIPQDPGIIGVLTCQESTIAHPFPKKTLWMQFLTWDVHCPTEPPELAGVRPRVPAGNRVHLLEPSADAETVVFDETFEIPLGLHRGGDGPGIMVSLMDPCLVDVGRTHKRSRVTLQDGYTLPSLSTVKCSVQTVKTGSYDDLVVSFHII